MTRFFRAKYKRRAVSSYSQPPPLASNDRLCENSDGHGAYNHQRCRPQGRGGLLMDYIRGTNRHQVMLFPESVEEYITEDNAVRFIDAFVESLDLGQLGFTRAH